MQGTIQTLRLERGFGFLRGSEGIEVLFHHSALPSPDYFASLTVGVVVEFEAEPSLEGPRHHDQDRARTSLLTGFLQVLRP